VDVEGIHRLFVVEFPYPLQTLQKGFIKLIWFRKEEGGRNNPFCRVFFIPSDTALVNMLYEAS